MPHALGHRRPAGLNLIEMMIAVAVLSLVLGSTIALLMACYRHYLDNETATAVHDRVVTVATLVGRELKDGNSGSFRIQTSPPGIVFASPRREDGKIEFDENTLQPLWQKWICYYIDDGDPLTPLVRKVELIATPDDQPPPVPVDKTSAYFRSSVAGGRVLAPGVTKLEFEAGPPLLLRLACQEIGHRGSSSQSEFSLEVSTKIAFRN